LLSPLHRLRILSSKDKKLFTQLRNLLGFYPGNIALYKLAFKHRSVAIPVNQGNFSASNERLEYLGDAILGAIVAEYLFKVFPYKDEGFLTKMRSRIVNRKQMNRLSLKLGVNKLLEFSGSGRQVNGSMHGDAMEALIGAVYLDKGYKRTTDFIVNRLLKIHFDLDELENSDTDFKSKIIEWSQKTRKKVSFDVAEINGKMHEKIYTIHLVIENKTEGTGTSHSKKAAEQQAAEQACEKLDLLQ
jgi:ribonuclease-3